MGAKDHMATRGKDSIRKYAGSSTSSVNVTGGKTASLSTNAQYVESSGIIRGLVITTRITGRGKRCQKRWISNECVYFNVNLQVNIFQLNVQRY